MTIQLKRLTGIMIGVSLLLLVPLVAMQFTREVNWTLSDFIIMGGLLYGTGFLCELVLRRVKRPGARALLCAGIVLILVLIWAELAVGVFGTPFAGS